MDFKDQGRSPGMPLFSDTKPRRRRRRCAAGVLLALMLVQNASAQARTVVTGVYHNAPKVFMDAEGRARGFFIDLIEAVARDEGWRLEYRPCRWEQCLKLLEMGEIDLMPDVAWSLERAQKLRFGREVALSSWSVFYTRRDRVLISLKDLDGATVAVVPDSIQYRALKSLAAELGIRPRYLEVAEMEAAFRKVRDGTADAALVNVYFGRRNAPAFGLEGSRVLVRPTLLYFAAAPSSSDQLLPVIDDHLRAWKQDRDSVYHQAMARWLSPEEGRLSPWLLWGAVAGVGSAVVLLALVFLFRALLKRRTAELEAKQRHLDHLAHHDPLTGLPNRLLFFDRLEQAIRHAHRRRQGVALLFLDLDQFKQINDTYGHDLGDRFLQEVARRLRHTVRESDTVARIGGDEFAVILEGLHEATDVAAAVQHLIQVFSKPVKLDGQNFLASCSIGISLYPQDGADVATLLRNADTAMFRAKAAGRNTFRLYDEAMTRETVELARMESALIEAVENQELEIYYQPQRVLSNGRLVGFEALLRWRHPELGEVPPDRFLPLAEDAGLMDKLGLWVLDAACRQSVLWQRKGLPAIRMAVNLSGRQLRKADLPERVDRLLNDCECKSTMLEFEITESFVMQQVETSISIMTRLREMGIELAIDDFGTGYSSLAYLKALPLSRLKIDRSFVAGVPEDENDCAIVRAIVALARALGLKVLAEGVERPAQARFLREIGCDEAQGYLYGKPMTAEEAERLLRRE